MMSHRRIGDQAAVVEVIRRKAHDRFVHAILHGELSRDEIAVVIHKTLHQTDRKAVSLGIFRKNRRRQLKMIASENQSVGSSQRNPAAGFNTLTGFVDHEHIEVQIIQHGVIKRRRRTNDSSISQQIIHRLLLQQTRLLSKFASFLTLLPSLTGAGLARVYFEALRSICSASRIN